MVGKQSKLNLTVYVVNVMETQPPENPFHFTNDVLDDYRLQKQENFSRNCCTELFTQIRVFMKWAWYCHLCIPFVEIRRESLEHLFILLRYLKTFLVIID